MEGGFYNDRHAFPRFLIRKLGRLVFIFTSTITCLCRKQITIAIDNRVLDLGMDGQNQQ